MHKMMRAHFKEVLFKLPFFYNLWSSFRRWQLHKDYIVRREFYEKIIQQRGLIYQEEETINAINARLRDRGYIPKIRKIGEVHTFAFIPDLSWHKQLLPDLRILGPLTVFDYVSHGYKLDEFYSPQKNGLERRKAMNNSFLSKLRIANQDRKVDWIFVYAQGAEVSASTIKKITEEFGIPTVNMCLDDKHCWSGPWMGDHQAGQIGIAPAFDISWTSARTALDWYLAEGGRPIYMPEGFDSSFYKPMPVNQDIPVSFVGGAYGFRPSIVRYLFRYGVPIHMFGNGWPESNWVDNIVEIFNRSMINFGMGGISYSEDLTNVKGRDFEIPGTGGGVYLTSFNPDLSQHFIIGEEILCYRNRYELIEMIRYYLKNPLKASTIAKHGFERCLREHRWLHRYLRLLEILGVMEIQLENKTLKSKVS